MKRKHLLFSLVVTLFMFGGFIGANQVSASETDTSDVSYSDLDETELSETIGNLSPDKQDDLFVAIMSKDTQTEQDAQILSILRLESEKNKSNQEFTKVALRNAVIGVVIFMIVLVTSIIVIGRNG